MQKVLSLQLGHHCRHPIIEVPILWGGYGRAQTSSRTTLPAHHLPTSSLGGLLVPSGLGSAMIREGQYPGHCTAPGLPRIHPVQSIPAPPLLLILPRHMLRPLRLPPPLTTRPSHPCYRSCLSVAPSRRKWPNYCPFLLFADSRRAALAKLAALTPCDIFS